MILNYYMGLFRTNLNIKVITFVQEMKPTEQELIDQMNQFDAIIMYSKRKLREDWENVKDLDDEKAVIEWAALCGFTDLVKEFNEELENQIKYEQDKETFLKS